MLEEINELRDELEFATLQNRKLKSRLEEAELVIDKCEKALFWYSGIKSTKAVVDKRTGEVAYFADKAKKALNEIINFWSVKK